MFLGGWSLSHAAEPVPVELQEVGIEENLGDAISLDLEFVDETGAPVPLRAFFDGEHPVLLNLVYYECPNLCNFLLNGFTEGLTGLRWTAGDEFQIVTVSIDPREGPELAATKKEAYLKLYKRSEAREGWHFLTGSESHVRQLAQEIGFRYRYDEDQKQYAHAAAVFVLTPQGEISRYLYGIDYPPRDLKLALLEASQGKIGNPVDKFLLFCYHYDPKGRRYALFATNLMKIAGGATVVGIIAFLFYLGIQHRRKENVSVT
ncbi:MAG: SCO family protein [Deltaproteobacteria bacterium]|nr:SCO family protein [Deltaproteobacteria bacterium]